MYSWVKPKISHICYEVYKNLKKKMYIRMKYFTKTCANNGTDYTPYFFTQANTFFSGGLSCHIDNFCLRRLERVVFFFIRLFCFPVHFCCFVDFMPLFFDFCFTYFFPIIMSLNSGGYRCTLTRWSPLSLWVKNLCGHFSTKHSNIGCLSFWARKKLSCTSRTCKSNKRGLGKGKLQIAHENLCAAS